MTCIITVTNGDWQYLDEWITYHHGIGVDMFLIGFNGNHDKFNELPQHDYVRYFDFGWSDLSVMNNVDRRERRFGYGNGVRFMPDVFTALLNTAKNVFCTCNYAICIDSDEFITIQNNEDINSFLDREFDKTKDFIHIGWKCYGNNGHIYNDGRPILERFDNPNIAFDPGHRSHLKYRKMVINLKHENFETDDIFMHSIHYLNKTLEYDKLFDIDKIYIKHFITKSLEEWIARFDHYEYGERIIRFKDEVLRQYVVQGRNELTDEGLKTIPEFIKKYKIRYRPEIEEKDDNLRNRYIEVNNIQL